MEQRSHWNRIGSAYQDEIFDVFRSDRLQLLPKTLKKYANAEHTAIDFGCGVGRAFEYLSPSFKSVLGIDISDNLLEIAKQTSFKNIEFKRHDLTKPLKAMADFGFCCNVIMLPEVEKNRVMFRNIRRSIKWGVTWCWFFRRLSHFSTLHGSSSNGIRGTRLRPKISTLRNLRVSKAPKPILYRESCVSMA